MCQNIYLTIIQKFKLMSDFQQKYLQQKRKCDNLLKMQKNIFNDVDQYSKAILDIRNYVKSIEGQDIDESEQLTPQIATTYSQQILVYIKRLGKPCECNRWKALYQKQSEETLKLNRYTEQLLNKLKQKEDQQSKDRVQINQLLNDYLQLFKKQFDVVKDDRVVSQEKKKKDSQSRSKSKNKNSSQTQRKHVKNMSNYETPAKDQHYAKLIIQRLERDASSLHKELEQFIDKNIELQQIVRIYRTKERKHLLANQCKWFQ